MEHVEHGFTLAEIFMGTIGVVLSAAFAGWAAIVRKAAGDMHGQIGEIIGELKNLREEIHKDRLHYEQRLTRLEHATGLAPHA